MPSRGWLKNRPHRTRPPCRTRRPKARRRVCRTAAPYRAPQVKRCRAPPVRRTALLQRRRVQTPRSGKRPGLFPPRILRRAAPACRMLPRIPVRRKKTLQTPRNVRWMQAKKRLARPVPRSCRPTRPQLSPGSLPCCWPRTRPTVSWEAWAWYAQTNAARYRPFYGWKTSMGKIHWMRTMRRCGQRWRPN